MESSPQTMIRPKSMRERLVSRPRALPPRLVGGASCQKLRCAATARPFQADFKTKVGLRPPIAVTASPTAGFGQRAGTHLSALASPAPNTVEFSPLSSAGARDDGALSPFLPPSRLFRRYAATGP